jgi:hypothetical protein
VRLEAAGSASFEKSRFYYSLSGYPHLLFIRTGIGKANIDLLYFLIRTPLSWQEYIFWEMKMVSVKKYCKLFMMIIFQRMLKATIFYPVYP